MIYGLVLFSFLDCLIFKVTFVYFSAQTGVLAPLHLHRRTAFFLLPVRHIKVFLRVQNFLLMCLRLASQRPSKWLCTGSFSLPPPFSSLCVHAYWCVQFLISSPFLSMSCLHEDMLVNHAGFVSEHYSMVLWIILLLTKFLEGKMTVKHFMESSIGFLLL